MRPWKQAWEGDQNANKLGSATKNPKGLLAINSLIQDLSTRRRKESNSLVVDDGLVLKRSRARGSTQMRRRPRGPLTLHEKALAIEDDACTR